MDDSFFGFDTSVPVEDDGSGGIGDCDLSEPPEDVFDALNDETFGSAINGDWEKSHEHMVKLDKLKNGPKKSLDSLLLDEDEEEGTENVEHNDEEENYDLEISLSQVKLDDVDISSDDTENRLQLDPSVWANPIKAITQPICRPTDSGYTNPEAFLRRHFSNPFEILLSQQQQLQSRQSFFTNPTPSTVHPSVQSLFPANANRRDQQATQQQKSKQFQAEQPQSFFSLQSMFFGNPSKPPNIMSVEDIERNIRNQQEQQKQQQQKQITTPQQHQEQQRQLQLQQKKPASNVKAISKVEPKNENSTHVTGSAFKESTVSQISLSQSSQPNQVHSQSQSNQTNVNFFNRPHSAVPLGFNAPRPNFNFSMQHPLNLITPANSGSMNNLQNQLIGHKNQPGFPPPNFPMLHHGMVASNFPPFPHGNFARPMPNLPVALNNFAMHPNFSAMRPLGPPVGMPPPRMPPHPALMNNLLLPPPGIMYPNPQNISMQSSSNANQFNQRLMQEIQQNHPMLANRNVMLNHNNQSHNINHNRQHQDKSKAIARANGNLPVEYDEYANLMSIRDKHWLIGIQLSQLNTETPYIDDYYYTIYKEKKAKQSGEIGQSKTHKDNQLNHPFSQPKGHAQLVILSMGKNGTQNRNGQNNRERRNSETANNKDKDNQQQQRNFNYTPLQFENSLGKLQYGSVTAPRKIIDMDIMGNENNTLPNTILEISAQRKSRYILLQIEILYKIVLKLEDLENPAAIATSLIVKEKKEKEKQIVLEQSFMSELNKCGGEGEIGDGDNVDLKTDSTSTSVSSSVSDKYSTYELESKDKLLEKLTPYLTIEKVTSMMTVRKGKTLIRRILPHIIDNPIRWAVWIGVFSCLQNVLKKDKDDNEGVLYSLYPEFKKQVRYADMDICNKIASSMRINDKKLTGFFSSKFCISSLVSLLLRAEEIYAESEDLSKSENDSNKIWSEFLSILSTALNRTVENQTITAEIESSAINPLVTHLSRFKHLKLDSLLTLFSQDKQQVE